jgi:hypothetical protein
MTMNTYTDERLLDKAGAVELLPTLPLDSPGATTEPTKSAPTKPTTSASDGATNNSGVPSYVPLKPGKSAHPNQRRNENPGKPRISRGF